MTDARTMRELALVQRLVRIEIQLIETRRRLDELEQAMTWMLHAHIPLTGIADGARQSWPHPNPDGSDTIGDAK